jgi:hypothetical protein
MRMSNLLVACSAERSHIHVRAPVWATRSATKFGVA